MEARMMKRRKKKEEDKRDMSEIYMEKAFALDDLCRSIVMRYAETARRFEEGVRRMPEISSSLQKGRAEDRRKDARER